jgi:peptidoglycan/LPS O-acetylase OafA/YrhL
MVALFALGALADERHWLADGLPAQLRRTCGRAAVIGLVLAALLGAAITITDDPDPYLGGLRLQAALIPVVEATIAVGMSLWAVDWFRRRCNRAGTLVRALGRASFAAFLLHAPITIIAAVALRDIAVTGEVKFLTVFTVTAAASYGLGWLLTRSHVAGRIL